MTAITRKDIETLCKEIIADIHEWDHDRHNGTPFCKASAIGAIGKIFSDFLEKEQK